MPDRRSWWAGARTAPSLRTTRPLCSPCPSPASSSASSAASAVRRNGVVPADAVTISNAGRLARACCCHCIRPSASSALSSGSAPGGTRTSSPLTRTSSAQLSEASRSVAGARGLTLRRPSTRRTSRSACAVAPSSCSPGHGAPAPASSSASEPSQASGAPVPCTLIEPRSSRMPATRRSRRSTSPSRTTSSRIRPCRSRAAVVVNVVSSRGPAVASVIRALPCSWNPPSARCAATLAGCASSIRHGSG